MSVIKLEPDFRKEIQNKMLVTTDNFNYCLSCTTCATSCPFVDAHSNMNPRIFMRKLILGMKEDILKDPFVWNCTNCGRCTMTCPQHIEVGSLVRTVRGNFGLTAPGYVQKIVDDHLRTGNQMEVKQEDYLDTLQWMEEELQEEVKDKNAKIPLDKKGAKYLYVLNPREVKYYATDILIAAKIFWAAGEDWTMSSKNWDGTNWALFNGRDNEARQIAKAMAEETKRLGIKNLVLSECGHAFLSNYWGSPLWLGEKPYEVKSILHLVEQYLEEGRIKVDPSKNNQPVTLHDPCNLIRKSKYPGIAEVPRNILKQVVTDFREMWPNRENNYCCGGGGGAVMMGSEYKKEVRMKKGKLKADQISKTGAKIVVTPCHNCLDQLNDINKEYQLGVKITQNIHLVNNALVLS
ncbi:MAG: (Fe-S)-binding protein [Peptococcaceae bacterium]|nr:(Fe-S)-binding protein [Peptococcaceae bacterium]